MLYLGLWSKIFKYFWAEALMMLIFTTIFFFSLLQGKSFDLLSEKMWPQYQDDPYFTVLVEAELSKNQLLSLKEVRGVEEVTTLDKEAIRLKLYNKFKSNGLEFPDEVFDKQMTLAKIFLKENLEPQIYQITRKQVISKLDGLSYEASEVKILRKSLKNVKSVQFLKNWSREIILLVSFILWAISLSIFYWRTFNLISLSQSFRFRSYVFEKFYLLTFGMMSILIIAYEAIASRDLDLAGVTLLISFLVFFIIFLKMTNFLRKDTA